MSNYILDTDIFSSILDDIVNLPAITRNNAIFYSTQVQHDEIKRVRDNDKRDELLSIFRVIKNIRLPVDSETFIDTGELFVLGISKISLAQINRGPTFDRLFRALNQTRPTNMMDNKKDALIAETALRNSLILITDDYILREICEDNRVMVMLLNEFLIHT